MLDIPIEDLLSLLVIMIAIVINLIVATKSFKSYRANKLTQTVLFGLTSLGMALAMIFLVGEKVFLSAILQNGDMGLIVGSIAIILSGVTVATVDSFAFNMPWPRKFKLLTIIAIIPIIVYLSLWMYSVWSNPMGSILWKPDGSGEIQVNSITQLAVYFTMVPLLIIPVLVFFYYAVKVRKESPISSKRSWVLGLGVMLISIAYIFEIIGAAALLAIPYFSTFMRVFFSIGAILNYWALFRIKSKQ